MPGKLPDQLRSELSKNKKVFETLAKLDMNGNMPQLWNCLYKIYDDENQSIMHNMMKTKLEQEPDRTPGFKQDQINSLNVFRENILQIVQMTVDYLHTSIMTDAEDPHSYGTTMKSVRNDSVETEVAIGEPNQHHKSYLSILTEHSGRERNSHVRTPGIDFEPIPINPNKPNRSYLDNPPILVLPDKQGIERLYVRHARHESQGRNSPSPATHLPQLENSFLTNGSQNKKRHYRLQSEFNYVKGSVKFNQSIRKPFLRDTESPGPANYTFDAGLSPILRRYAIPTIGKAPRKTTLGVIGTNESPGPATYYPSRHLVTKG